MGNNHNHNNRSCGFNFFDLFRANCSRCENDYDRRSQYDLRRDSDDNDDRRRDNDDNRCCRNRDYR